MALRLLSVMTLSIMFACVKYLSQHGVEVIESLFYRQLILLLVVLIWIGSAHLKNSGSGFELLRTQRPGAHLVRMIVGIIAMGFNFWSFTLLPMAEATTIGFAVPIFATVMAALFLREPTGIHRWAAVFIGFLGVLLVLQPGSAHISLAGGSVAIIAALLTASVTVVIRRLGATERAPTIVFWFALTSLLPLTPAMWIIGSAHPPLIWAIILLMGIAGGIAQLALTASLRLAPVALVMPMDYTGLLWASLIGLIVFAQWPSPMTWIGAPIIIASGLYILWREQKARQLTAKGTSSIPVR